MRKLWVILFIVLLAMSMTTISVSAASGVAKGQKIFKKKFRKYCRFSGAKFSRKHTQGEWEELWNDGKFIEEAKKICPRLKVNKIKKSWWENVYEFSRKYASDGVVPKC